MIFKSIRVRALAVAGIAFGLTTASLIAVYLPQTVTLAREPYKRVEKLLATDTTILGQPIAYPAREPARVTAVIVTLRPGEETGWHTHAVPLFGYIMEGELTVDYGKQGKKVYKSGDSVIEAMNTPHNGTSSGTGSVRIMAVFMGAQGVANTTMIDVRK